MNNIRSPRFLNSTYAAPGAPADTRSVLEVHERLSFILVVKDDGVSAAELYVRLAIEVASLGRDMELVLAYCGPEDEACSTLSSLALRYARVRTVLMPPGLDEVAALAAGCRAATGETIFTLTARMSCKAKQIEKCLEKIEAGFEIVTMSAEPLRPENLSPPMGSKDGTNLACFRRRVLQDIDFCQETAASIPWPTSVRGLRTAHLGHVTTESPAAVAPTSDDSSASQASVILVADDQPAIRTVVRMRLEFAGLNVRESHSGMSVLTHLRLDVAVVILDLSMPGLNGMDCLRQIRQRRPALKVIVLTGAESVELAVEAMKLGAFDYIRKPFDSERLLAAVVLALHSFAVAAHQSSVVESRKWKPLGQTVEKAMCLV